MERGDETGYLHWQLLVYLERTQRLSYLKTVFGSQIHAERTRSAAAEDYVWKEETRVEGTQFELGRKPFKRSSKRDWDAVYKYAQEGKFDLIDGCTKIHCFQNLKRIRADNDRPTPMERNCRLYWGESGAGKTRRAYEEAGDDVYWKISSNKWWDGYDGQSNVIIDEFNGSIAIEHILRWTDRYPVPLEVKGSYSSLKATNIWFTSNRPLDDWFPDANPEQRAALRRRFTTIEHMSTE